MTQKQAKSKRQADIINAAIDEFLEKGYEGTSMDTIAQRSGLSKGGLYHHFRSKNQLLLCGYQKLTEPISALTKHAQALKSAESGLRSYIQGYLEYWNERPREVTFFFLSMTKAVGAPEVWSLYGWYAEETINFLTDLFEKGIEQEEFIPHHARQNAISLMAALDGIIGYLLMDDELEIEEVAASFEARFVDAVKKAKFTI